MIKLVALPKSAGQQQLLVETASQACVVCKCPDCAELCRAVQSCAELCARTKFTFELDKRSNFESVTNFQTTEEPEGGREHVEHVDSEASTSGYESSPAVEDVLANGGRDGGVAPPDASAVASGFIDEFHELLHMGPRRIEFGGDLSVAGQAGEGRSDEICLDTRDIFLGDDTGYLV